MEQDLIPKIIFSEIGFEFEFFSNYSLKDTATLLSKKLDKRVVPYYKKDNVVFVPSKYEFQLIRDISGGKKLLELITGPLPYNEAKIVLLEILEWISLNGKTDKNSAFHINISFDKKSKVDIKKLNLLKFILEFDEDFIFSRFPNRTDNVYAKSIKNIFPLNKYVFIGKDRLDPRNYEYPIGKWYGFNFKKLNSGYVECRYLGGIDYQYKNIEILEILDYIISKLYDCIISNEISEISKNELDRIINEHSTLIDAFQNYKNFKTHYKNINLTVDLQNNEQVITSHFNRMKDLLFDVLNKGELKEGSINYDSDVSKLQLKNCKLYNSSYLSNLDIVDCELTGIIENCEIYHSKIENAHIRECISTNCTISNSRVRNMKSNNKTVIQNSYIFGSKSIHSAKIIGGFFVSGKVTQYAELSDDVEIFKIQKIKYDDFII